jgi:hypothetical protein
MNVLFLVYDRFTKRILTNCNEGVLSLNVS